jgi:hypothetical protein
MRLWFSASVVIEIGSRNGPDDCLWQCTREVKHYSHAMPSDRANALPGIRIGRNGLALSIEVGAAFTWRCNHSSQWMRTIDLGGDHRW